MRTASSAVTADRVFKPSETRTLARTAPPPKAPSAPARVRDGLELRRKAPVELNPRPPALHLDPKQQKSLGDSLREFAYESKLRGMSDEALDAELKKQREILEDAKTGPVKDADAAREARERIASLNEEKARRILAEPNVSAEQVADALKNLDADAGGATGQSTYTVQPGDTLSQVASRISAENGGVPDAQTVLNDIVRMNPQIENPDLIYPDQQINVPQYGAGSPGSSSGTPSPGGPTESGEPTGPTSEPTSEPSTPGTSTPGAVMSPEEAFICQFTEVTYNPTGPSSSANCGPASLAMGLAYTGRMPPGLSKEQQVDYARALMCPSRAAEFTYVTDANGNQVPQLDRDHEYTEGTMVADGIRAAGGNPIYGETWGDLDAQLEAGHPVMAGGWVSDAGGDGLAWKQQFPGGVGPGAYGTGTTGHLISILGKTADGKYIVADPLYARGPVEMTREQLSLYFSQTGGNPSFTALG